MILMILSFYEYNLEPEQKVHAFCVMIGTDFGIQKVDFPGKNKSLEMTFKGYAQPQFPLCVLLLGPRVPDTLPSTPP